MPKQKLEKLENLAIDLLGIFSFESPTKLVWEINQMGIYDFVRIADLAVNSGSADLSSYHSQFRFNNEAIGTVFTLIKNKGSKLELLKTNIEIPYFLFAQMGDYKLAMDEIMGDLKKSQNIKAIQRLDNKILNKLVAYI